MVLITLTLWFPFSCRTINPKEEFLSRYNLKQHQKLYIISMYSCGGCLQEKVIDKLQEDDMIVFDTTSLSTYSRILKNRKHSHMSNDSLEQIFGMFSNVILIIKEGENYSEEKIEPQ
jgi:hypothetical protein